VPDETPKTAIPRSGRVAGIDFGTVRIGVAITDPGQRFASPLENYHRRSPRLDEQFFVRLVDEERIVGFVVGLPVHTSGNESQKSREARSFGDGLARFTGVPVAFFDERYTSAIAEELLQGAGLTSKKRKARLDKIAAQILLASWLESSRTSESAGPIEDP
jgi:putative Holliday junction resolvase